MSFSVTLSAPSLSSFPRYNRRYLPTNSSLKSSLHQFRIFQTLPRLHASRRNSNFPPGSEGLGDDSRKWGRSIGSEFDDDEDEDGDEDDDEDRSFDLLVRFVQNVFKKISRRARRAVRSVLPITISTKLVGFSVNGVLILAFLWVLKAFLEWTAWFSALSTRMWLFISRLNALLCTAFHMITEVAVGLLMQVYGFCGKVICTLGSVVFVSILLIRGIWTGITYLQEGRQQKLNAFDDDHRAWTGTQPST